MATQEELLRQRARRGQAPGAASGPVPDSRDADQDLVGNAAIQDQMLADRDQGLLDQAGFQGRSMDLPFADEVSAAFGIDPAAVQAYQGNRGAMDALNANAFATGDTVAFRDASPSRDQVFEEVAHVVQQSRGQGRGVSDQGASSERYAGAGQAVGSGADASLHRDAAGADEEEISLPAKADSIAEITIKPGGTYTVSEADLDNGEGEAWKKIARAHGMHEDLLIPFNQHVASVEVDGAMANMAVAPQLVQGVQLYIPSAEELAFAECRRKAGSYEEAVTLYGELASGSSIKLITAARDRASGRVGESYGTKGVDGPKDGAGVFLTPNKDLAGASRRRSEKIDGQREYRVNWNASHDGFWKCSVFLHDNLFQAGYTPDLTSNDHYRLAGQLHESKHVTEISHSEAGPGSLWQRFGGRGSDESHNAILSSFVDVTPIDDTTETWDFSIIGAETDRAAESQRSHTMKKGTNENTGGKKIRFFKPKGS